MSITSEINRIKTNIVNAYSEVETKGGTLPVTQDSANLADAIASIPEGSGEPEYTQLQFIENTGTQYINTGIKPDNTTRFEINAIVKSGGEPNYPVIMGATEVVNGSNISYIVLLNHIGATTPNIYFEYNNGLYKTRTGIVTLNTFNTYSFIGTTISVISATTTRTITNVNNLGTFSLKTPLNLFGCRDDSGSLRNKLSMYMQLFSCKIWKNNELVRSFIPVKDKNNVVCLYDKVSKTYFYNEGTGTFKAGPEI